MHKSNEVEMTWPSLQQQLSYVWEWEFGVWVSNKIKTRLIPYFSIFGDCVHDLSALPELTWKDLSFPISNFLNGAQSKKAIWLAKA